MQGLDWGAVAALYVVGGASALPLVGRLLRERYGRKVRTSPYPHAATAIGLAIAADQEAGYALRERFTRHFGVWREAEAGRAVAFDVVFAKDCLLPALGQAPLTCTRRYQPTHTIGHFRYFECSQLTDTGAPALHEAGHLPTAPITTLTQEAPWIKERYTCDAHGVITVEMQNQTCPDTRRFHLRGTGPRAPLKVGCETQSSGLRAQCRTTARHPRPRSGVHRTKLLMIFSSSVVTSLCVSHITENGHLSYPKGMNCLWEAVDTTRVRASSLENISASLYPHTDI